MQFISCLLSDIYLKEICKKQKKFSCVLQCMFEKWKVWMNTLRQKVLFTQRKFHVISRNRILPQKILYYSNAIFINLKIRKIEWPIVLFTKMFYRALCFTRRKEMFYSGGDFLLELLLYDYNKIPTISNWLNPVSCMFHLNKTPNSLPINFCNILLIMVCMTASKYTNNQTTIKIK